MGKISLITVLEWLTATVIVAATTVFTVMRFAYSDFSTQRETDTYRGQLEKRLDNLRDDVRSLNEKVDRLLERQISR